MFSRRDLAVFGASTPFLLAAPRVQAAGAQPHTLEELTREAAAKDAALSPDGSKVALMSQRMEGGEPRSSILVVDVRTTPKALNTVALGEGRGEWVLWANPERLLICVSVEAVFEGKRLGSLLAQRAGRIRVARILSVGVNGENPVVLFNNRRRLAGRNLDLSQVADLTPDDPDHVLIPAWESDRYGLFKVNVYTGAATRIEQGDPATRGFAAQNGQAVLRFDINGRGTMLKILGRAPGERDWTRIAQTPLSDIFSPTFEVLGVAPDPGVVHVLARRGEDPTRAVWRYDLKTKAFGAALNSRADLDADSATFDADGSFVAARYVDDRVVYGFADRDLPAHFKAVNAFFGDSCNVVIAGISRNRRRLLLWASGPQEPGGYFLYDLDRTAVDALVQSRPWLASDRLAKVESLRVKTRDGQTIRAYLTTPPGVAGRAPLVMMPHGGPEARDQVDFDLWAQCLAAQGWLVAQPQFRGSDGFGRAFADAGRRQWGGRMQDDVTDTARHLIDSGRADPDRVAILGWSYGGYAALMGAVATPDLYKAVVAGAGPSDLVQVLEDERTSGELDFGIYDYWVRTIGDPRADRAALERASPRRRAAEVKAPVLLVHGDDDGVVAVDHSRAMLRALQSAGKTVTYLELESQGHSPDAEAEARFLKAAVDFLKPRLA